MEIKDKLTKRFKAARRLLHRDEQKTEARYRAEKAKAVLKKAKQESRGKRSFKERLLNLTQRLPGRK
jgi:hypothetical protein